MCSSQHPMTSTDTTEMVKLTVNRKIICDVVLKMCAVLK